MPKLSSYMITTRLEVSDASTNFIPPYFKTTPKIDSEFWSDADFDNCHGQVVDDQLNDDSCNFQKYDAGRIADCVEALLGTILLQTKTIDTVRQFLVNIKIIPSVCNSLFKIFKLFERKIHPDSIKYAQFLYGNDCF